MTPAGSGPGRPAERRPGHRPSWALIGVTAGFLLALACVVAAGLLALGMTTT